MSTTLLGCYTSYIVARCAMPCLSTGCHIHAGTTLRAFWLSHLITRLWMSGSWRCCCDQMVFLSSSVCLQSPSRSEVEPRQEATPSDGISKTHEPARAHSPQGGLSTCRQHLMQLSRRIELKLPETRLCVPSSMSAGAVQPGATWAAAGRNGSFGIHQVIWGVHAWAAWAAWAASHA